MQRRESVRVPVPADKPCYCTVRISTEPPQELRLRVQDISIGGLGLLVPATEKVLLPGTTLAECSLDLAGIGVMRCTLNIVYRVEAHAGSQDMRLGCHFVDLAALSREQVRSHVSRLERANLATG
jgi:c-di-GMP-binding flagellar brake protein YcgR